MEKRCGFRNGVFFLQKKEAFDEASGVAVYSLWFRGEYDYTIADRLPCFRISASQQGDGVIFSGEGLDNTSEYQLSVEGRFPQKQYTNNMLYLDIKRTASNETALAGNTFLLNLDASFVDLNEYDGEYIVTTDHIRQHPLSFYFDCLHKVLGYKTLKLAFGEDNKVSIEGKDERSGQFVPFEGKYQYFMTSSNKGYIDMDLDSDLALLYKSLGDNKEVEREEWRNAAYASFELKASSEGEILLSLPVTNISDWVFDYYLDNKEKFELYHPNYWLKKFNLDDLLWIQLSQTGAN